MTTIPRVLPCVVGHRDPVRGWVVRLLPGNLTIVDLTGEQARELIGDLLLTLDALEGKFG